MKLETNNAPVEVVGGNRTSSFSIAMNAKAFRVLSDTMYQNKIGSIVREICCNAYDAHVAAGNREVPFDVHLPDAFEPWFAVKDYGIGLTPDEVRNVLTVYFQSTKDQSNDSIGAFGLGAKTPFSYTDQFTVTSVKDGKKHIYSAFISSSGVPDIIEMHAEDSTEPNGVEIKVSVKREDYQRFKQELQAQLQFFKVKPNTNIPVGYDSLTHIDIKTENISIGNSNNGYAKTWIVQGNVGYALDLQQLSGKISKEAYVFLYSLNSRSVILTFDIGQIGVTASREGVEYNATTVKNIENRVLEVMKEVAATVQADFDNCKNDWDKAVYLNENLVANLVNSSFKINTAKRVSNRWVFDLSACTYPDGWDYLKPSPLYGYMCSISAYYINRSTPVTQNQVIVPSSRPVIIFLKDKSASCNKRIKHYLSGKHFDSVFQYVANDGVYDQALIDRLVKTLGGHPTVVKLSDIELPVPVGGVKPRSNTPTYYSCGNSEYTEPRYWTKEFDALGDLDDDVVYVVVENLVPTSTDAHSASEQNKAIVEYQALVELEKDIPALIAIREKTLKKIDGLTNFTSLVDYITEKKKEFNTPEVCRFLRKSQTAHQAYHALYQESNLTGLIKVAKETEYVRLLMSIKENYQKYVTSPNANRIRKIGDFISFSFVNSRKQIKIDKKKKKLLDKYPLLQIQSDYTVKKAFGSEALGTYLVAMELYYNTLAHKP